MAAEMKASVTLTLKDDLTKGIEALTRRLERMADLFQRLSRLGDLSKAMDASKLEGQVNAGNRALDSMVRKAGQVKAALRNISTEPIMVNMRGTAFLPPSLTRATMAATILAAAAAGSGAGGGGITRMPPLDAHFAARGQMLLGGPGGGIPLAPLNPWLMGMGNLQASASAIRREFGTIAGQVQHIGRGMGELGHASLTAAATGFGLMEPIRKYAEQDNILRHVSITEGRSGDALEARIKTLTGQLNGLALETAQKSDDLAHAYNFLVTTPLKEHHGVIDKIMPVMARASTAYNVPIPDMAQGVYAMVDSLKITPEELPGALSATMYGAKEAHFGAGDFSRNLPEIAGSMALMGWTGRGALNSVVAGLETVVQNSAMPSQAATDYRDLLMYVTSPAAEHAFKKNAGIDLHKELIAGVNLGKNPLDSFLDIMEGMIKGEKDPFKQSLILRPVLHNQQAGTGAVSLIMHRPQMRAMEKRLAAVDASTMQTDYLSARFSPLNRLREVEEKLTQVLRKAGEGFMPILDRVDHTLDKILAVFAWIDGKKEGATAGILGWIGGVFAASAVLGVMISLFRLAGSGAGLFGRALGGTVGAIALLSRGLVAVFTTLGAIAGLPIETALAAVVGLAGAAYLIYSRWNEIGPALGQVITGIGEGIAGLFTLDRVKAHQGLVNVTDGLRKAFSALDGAIRDAASSFAGWVDGLFDNRISAAIKAITDKIAELKRAMHLDLGDGKPAADVRGDAEAGGGGGLAPSTPRTPFQSFMDREAGGGGGMAGAGAAATPARVEVIVGVDPKNGQIYVNPFAKDAPPGLTILPMDRGDMTRHD